MASNTYACPECGLVHEIGLLPQQKSGNIGTILSSVREMWIVVLRATIVVASMLIGVLYYDMIYNGIDYDTTKQVAVWSVVLGVTVLIVVGGPKRWADGRKAVLGVSGLVIGLAMPVLIGFVGSIGMVLLVL